MTQAAHFLSGAYALDALPAGAERDAFGEHLLACEQCRLEVRSLRETAAVLSVAVTAPVPPGMRDRVLGQIRQTEQERPAGGGLGDERVVQESATRDGGAPSGGVVPLQRAGGTGRRRASRLVAATVLVAGLGLATAGVVQLQQARQEADQTRRQAAEVLAITADPASRRISADVAGGGRATLVAVGPRAVLLAAGLRGLAPDRTYQLWVLHATSVTSAGLGPQGSSAGQDWNRLVHGLAGGDTVAISIEPAGGSAQPTTRPIALLKT